MRIPKNKLTAGQTKIRECLENNLKTRNVKGEYYQDLIEDYMYMLVLKDRLQKDIDENGVRITTYNAKGLPVEKKNDSYDLLLKYNKQMISLLEYLGINPKEIEIGSDDDEL